MLGDKFTLDRMNLWHKYSLKKRQEEEMTNSELFELIQGLLKERFYGELLIKFESGRIVILKKSETIKLKNK